MKDPEQRNLRSEAIRLSYERGTHTLDHAMKNCYGVRGFYEGHFYASKAELRRIKFLISSGVRWKRYEVGDFDFRIRYEWEEKLHVYIPDFVIHSSNGVVIEEFKSNLTTISDLERFKISTATDFLLTKGILFRAIDDPNFPID